MEQDNVRIVQQALGAFLRGDLPGLLSFVAEDCDWYTPGPEDIPFAGQRHGPDGVAQFFTSLMQTIEPGHWEPHEVIPAGEHVLVLGYAQGRVRATGREYESRFAILVTVRDGKVVRFREYGDTWSLVSAFRNL
ncbi:MAG: nuclear transport factor 2 family protein [Armatimonadetes bacterium]|nr:nuclear transport factor 2 family protein [Armatimonadota bacterium]